MRAAVYLRQSIDSTGEGLAVARQREDCLSLCSVKGWEPVEYVDNDTSATKGHRPAYQRMLSDLREGSVQAVVSWDLDRLHRQPRELEEFIDLAERHGTALATVGGEADLSTDSGRLFARIKGAVARAEVERKGARQRRANDQRADRGMPAKATVRRFGYDDDGVTPRKSEAAIVARIYSDLLAGKSQRSIAAQLNEQGVLTTRGGQWNQSSIRALVMRAHSAGFLVHRGEIVGRGSWAPIVSEETWRAALALVTDPARQRGGATPRRLLTQIARCGVCGEFVHSTAGGGARQYVCRTGKHVSRRAVPLDALVVGVVVGRLSRPDALDLLAAPTTGDTADLRAEADTLRGRLESLAIEFADGTLTGGQLRAATDRLKSRIGALEGQLADAGKARVLAPLIGAEDVRATWDALAVERQRGVVETLIDVTILPGHPTRTFDPETVRIEWRQP